MNSTEVDIRELIQSFTVDLMELVDVSSKKGYEGFIPVTLLVERL